MYPHRETHPRCHKSVTVRALRYGDWQRCRASLTFYGVAHHPTRFSRHSHVDTPTFVIYNEALEVKFIFLKMNLLYLTEHREHAPPFVEARRLTYSNPKTVEKTKDTTRISLNKSQELLQYSPFSSPPFLVSTILYYHQLVCVPTLIAAS